MADDLLTIKDVCRLTALSRSTIYVLVKKKLFPAPLTVGHRSIRWEPKEIEKWIESCKGKEK